MPKVEVVHMTSPVCQWSWGFEPVINRLRMRYGKQIDIFAGVALPYTDRAQWLKDYEMSETEAMDWMKSEIIPRIGMPMMVPRSFMDMPSSTLPQAIAVKAAGIVHGPRAEARLHRALLMAAFIEGLDTADEKVLVEVITRLGLDNAKMSEVAATDAPGNALGDDGARGGHGANFFSLMVRDAEGNTVTLPYAYDEARVEKAIHYLSGGKAKPKAVKPDVVAYVEEHLAVPLVELQKVFALPAAKVKPLVAKAEKAGRIEKFTYPALPKVAFWRPATDTS